MLFLTLIYRCGYALDRLVGMIRRRCGIFGSAVFKPIVAARHPATYTSNRLLLAAAAGLPTAARAILFSWANGLWHEVSTELLRSDFCGACVRRVRECV